MSDKILVIIFLYDDYLCIGCEKKFESQIKIAG